MAPPRPGVGSVRTTARMVRLYLSARNAGAGGVADHLADAVDLAVALRALAQHHVLDAARRDGGVGRQLDHVELDAELLDALPHAFQRLDRPFLVELSSTACVRRCDSRRTPPSCAGCRRNRHAACRASCGRDERALALARATGTAVACDAAKAAPISNKSLRRMSAYCIATNCVRMIATNILGSHL